MDTDQEEGKGELSDFFFHDASYVCPCHCVPAASLCLPRLQTRVLTAGYDGWWPHWSPFYSFHTRCVLHNLIFPFLQKGVVGEGLDPRVRLPRSTSQPPCSLAVWTWAHYSALSLIC